MASPPAPPPSRHLAPAPPPAVAVAPAAHTPTPNTRTPIPTACGSCVFYNAPSLQYVVLLQALLTFVGNTTLAFGAYRVACSNGWAPQGVWQSLTKGDDAPVVERPTFVPGTTDASPALALPSVFAITLVASYVIKYGETLLPSFLILDENIAPSTRRHARVHACARARARARSTLARTPEAVTCVGGLVWQSLRRCLSPHRRHSTYGNGTSARRRAPKISRASCRRVGCVRAATAAEEGPEAPGARGPRPSRLGARGPEARRPRVRVSVCHVSLDSARSETDDSTLAVAREGRGRRALRRARRGAARRDASRQPRPRKDAPSSRGYLSSPHVSRSSSKAARAQRPHRQTRDPPRATRVAPRAARRVDRSNRREEADCSFQALFNCSQGPRASVLISLTHGAAPNVRRSETRHIASHTVVRPAARGPRARENPPRPLPSTLSQNAPEGAHGPPNARPAPMYPQRSAGGPRRGGATRLLPAAYGPSGQPLPAKPPWPCLSTGRPPASGSARRLRGGGSARRAQARVSTDGQLRYHRLWPHSNAQKRPWLWGWAGFGAHA